MEKGEKRKKFLEDMKLEQKAKGKKIGKGLVGTATALGITASIMGCSQEQVVPILPEKKPAVEAQKTDYVQIQTNLALDEQMIDAFEKQEDVEKFLRNEYIEEYEREKGESKLTTENIFFKESYHDYVFVNKDTGDLITHGKDSYKTEHKLAKKGISYEKRQNVKVYEVHYCEGNKEKIIDAMALKGIPNENNISQTIPVKVIMGDSSFQSYKSVLNQMADIIEKGIDYARNIEGNESVKEMKKQLFKEALCQWKAKQQFWARNNIECEIGD